MKILLIEPDEYYHHHFGQALSSLGELRISPDAGSVAGILQEGKPDAIVMEILLPDRPGYEILEEIRKSEEHQNVPVIIFSKVGNLEDIQESLRYGIAGYFVKGQDGVHDVKKLLLALSF